MSMALQETDAKTKVRRHRIRVHVPTYKANKTAATLYQSADGTYVGKNFVTARGIRTSRKTSIQLQTLLVFRYKFGTLLWYYSQT